MALTLITVQSGWITHSGANKLEVAGDVVRIRQLGLKATSDYSYALKPLNINDPKNWSVRFTVKYPKLGEQGARVSLERAGKKVVWTGADGWFKGASTFVGEKLVHTFPADDQAHTFEFKSVSGVISVSVDGKKCAGTIEPAMPDTIFVGSGPGGTSGTQTEIELSDLVVDSGKVATTLETDTHASPRPVTSGPTVWSMNDHAYEIVRMKGVTWTKAKQLAEARSFRGMKGHLVTVTSADEALFVTSLGDQLNCWYGAYQKPGSVSHSEGWTWITGEPWNYTNWKEGQPDDFDHKGRGEDKLSGLAVLRNGAACWNDFHDDGCGGVSIGYVVEYEPAAQPSTNQLQDRLSTIFGADYRVIPTVQPSGLGKIRVTGSSVRVLVPVGTTLECQPSFSRPDVKLQEVSLFVNGRLVRSEIVFSNAKLPLFTVVADASPGLTTKIHIKGEDDRRNVVDLARIELTTETASKSTSASLSLVDDRIEMSKADSSQAQFDIFLGTEFLGRVQEPDKFKVDARRIPPGQHELWVIGISSTGLLSAPSRSLIEIRPRFSVTSKFERGTFVVEGEQTSLPLHVSRNTEAFVSTRVYVRGSMIAENKNREFDANISMLDVPTGSLIVEVVGVTDSGAMSPPEVIRVDVRSPFHDNLLVKDARRKKLQEMIAKMSEFDRNVAYWYERAKQEPAFRTVMSGKVIFSTDEFGRSASIGYVDSITVPGDAARFLAECRAAMIRRAEHRLEIGRLQKLLGNRESAISTLRQVIAETGEKSGIGLLALQELSGL